MRLAVIVCGLALFGGVEALFGEEKVGECLLFPSVETYVNQRSQEFGKIPVERKAQLEKIAQYVTKHVKTGQTARLNFICTHNSRRSHMSQIWAEVAACKFGVPGVETYSGGTEASTFNPRAIAAMERAGFKVETTDKSKNPRYEVRYQETTDPLICFSKVYDESPNPKDDFCAVMTCSHADTNCPIVKGSSLRVAIPFDDPKVADGTPEEASKYDERCAQICREMLYIFSRVEK